MTERSHFPTDQCALRGKMRAEKPQCTRSSKSMFYGISRQREGGAKNDVYATYEPWENRQTMAERCGLKAGARNFALPGIFIKIM